MNGSASAPDDALLNETPYWPVTVTFAPAAGSGFGTFTPQFASLYSALSLPLSNSSMASKIWAKLEAHPITLMQSASAASFVSPIQNAGTGALQFSGSALPALWTAHSGASFMLVLTI